MKSDSTPNTIRPNVARVESEPLARGEWRLRLLLLICVMYLVFIGGAYGLEDAVRLAGHSLAVLLSAGPTDAQHADRADGLTALMPVEGGFYCWVK